MIGKYRKKAVVVEAMQYNGNAAEVTAFIGDLCIPEGDHLVIHTLVGDAVAHPGTWIIRNRHNEIYICPDEVFREMYEAVP